MELRLSFTETHQSIKTGRFLRDIATSGPGHAGHSSHSPLCTASWVHNHAIPGTEVPKCYSLWSLFSPVVSCIWGFPCSASGKELACQCRRHKRHRFDPWVRKIPWIRAWQPTPVFLPGESHGQRSLACYSPWGCKESDTTERLSMHPHILHLRLSLFPKINILSP